MHMTSRRVIKSAKGTGTETPHKGRETHLNHLGRVKGKTVKDLWKER